MTKGIFNLLRAQNMLSVLLLGIVTACGSALPRQPIAIEQAIKADQEAHRAVHDGDLMRARELFKQSMLMQQSLDNLPAATMAAINLSSVAHKLRDDGTALALLDGILAHSDKQIPSELRAAAAFRKGVILADTNKPAEAESALQLAIQECNGQCILVSGLNSLRARLALDNGGYAAALAMAKEVINAGTEPEEMANAQRIAAAAETALGQQEAALAHYQAALELDKKLALSARIAEDLKGIAILLEKLGRKQEAELFARRAESVVASAQLLPGNAAKKLLP